MNTRLDARIRELVPQGEITHTFADDQTTVTIRKLIDEVGIAAMIGSTLLVEEHAAESDKRTIYFRMGSPKFGPDHTLEYATSDDPTFNSEEPRKELDRWLEFCEAHKA